MNASFLMNDSDQGNIIYCDTQPQNPYCGRFGSEELIDVIFLFIFAIVGTFGNFLVIFSIVYEERAYKHGNMFIINLAVADLIVCMLAIPVTIPNVVIGDRFLPITACHVIGYLATISCTCSICNHSFIAFNRFWSIVHRNSNRIFSRSVTILLAVSAWIWSVAITSPTFLGWSGLSYDYKMTVCAWDDQASVSFNIFFMTVAIGIPTLVIGYCYFKIYSSVHQTNKKLYKTSRSKSTLSVKRNLQTKAKQRISLLKTLAVTVVAFVVSWTPYAVIVLFFVDTVPPKVKKASIRVALSNSAFNFAIYGLMNPVYRKGYGNFLYWLSCCKKHCNWLLSTEKKKRNERRRSGGFQVSSSM